MKCKVVLRYGLADASNYPPLGTAVNSLLEGLGLTKTRGEGWESKSDLSLDVAAEKLSQVLKTLANPRTVPRARGELKFFMLYIERR